MSWLDDAGNWLAQNLGGQADPKAIANINNQVQGPTAIQIAGMPQYQTAMHGLQTAYGQAGPNMSGYAAQYGDIGQGAANAYGNIAANYGQLGQNYGTQMANIGQQQAGLYGGIPQGPNLGQATGQSMGQLQQLQGYQQNVAMGQAPSAADQMLQNQMANLGKQTQSGIVSAGGMNPALALRQLFQNQSTQGAQLGAAGAQQKLQEQLQFGQQAGANAQAMYGQNFNNAQQGFQNQNQTYGNQMNNLAAQGQTAEAGLQGQQSSLAGQAGATGAQANAKMQAVQQQQQAIQTQFLNRMQGLKAQEDIANNVFSANARQATFNQDYQSNQQAYQMWQATQQKQAIEDQARAKGSMMHGLISGALTIGGGIAGTMIAPGLGTAIGAGLGGQLGNMFGGGGGGGSSSMDPAMLAMMMRGQPQGDGAAPIPGAGDMGGGASGSFNEGAVNPYMNGPGSPSAG